MNYYCKLFIQTELSKEGIAEKIVDLLGIQFNRHFSTETDFFTLDIRDNRILDEHKEREQTTDFLFFPYFLDIDILNEKKSKEYKAVICQLLHCFREVGWQAVAACDFEEELIQNSETDK
ncbi:hypothetical protein I6N96_19235 [Enterococcus sp. BWM-S5]|uniref:1,4-dihydroxy-6-naphthoate synthase n=1 Tax=Enterococcus larvae TaxID=2794352 RepID=A0ABS4CPC7_9ENTE|nr:hypothetical protein [Enterococcus larvae]MBP1048419.1 hypothetical protein [Enterococcus larvae]